jgi:D-lactate dehydrogenase
MIKAAKIVFFDVKDHEKHYLQENMPAECECVFIEDSLQTNFDKNIAKVKNFDILSVFTSSRVPAELLEKFENLKLVTTRSTGFSHIDIDYCKTKDIPVVNVPRYGDCTVAEFAFGLLLNVARNINIAYENLQKGVINTQKYIGIDLFGKTIGIIGTGAIGSNAIRIAKGFNMDVLAFDPCPKKELEEKYGVRYVTPDELYAKSDIISIHAPSTKENFHMVNEEAFTKMKKGIIIINTARGEIMDTEALYRAILNGTVSGAGLDVLECEEILANEDQYIAKIDCLRQDCLAKTLINHKLMTLPNIIVTPHVAFDTKEAIQRILETTVCNINGYLSGDIVNRVN